MGRGFVAGEADSCEGEGEGTGKAPASCIEMEREGGWTRMAGSTGTCSLLSARWAERRVGGKAGLEG